MLSPTLSVAVFSLNCWPDCSMVVLAARTVTASAVSVTATTTMASIRMIRFSFSVRLTDSEMRCCPHAEVQRVVGGGGVRRAIEAKVAHVLHGEADVAPGNP